MQFISWTCATISCSEEDEVGDESTNEETGPISKKGCMTQDLKFIVWVVKDVFQVVHRLHFCLQVKA